MKTPLTDAEAVRATSLDDNAEVVPAELARTLERENAELRAALVPRPCPKRYVWGDEHGTREEIEQEIARSCVQNLCDCDLGSVLLEKEPFNIRIIAQIESATSDEQLRRYCGCLEDQLDEVGLKAAQRAANIE